MFNSYVSLPEGINGRDPNSEIIIGWTIYQLVQDFHKCCSASSFGDFHSHGDTPIAGWFIMMENLEITWMI